jgi:hypothetical protein
MLIAEYLRVLVLLEFVQLVLLACLLLLVWFVSPRSREP